MSFVEVAEGVLVKLRMLFDDPVMGPAEINAAFEKWSVEEVQCGDGLLSGSGCQEGWKFLSSLLVLVDTFLVVVVILVV
jgi:hypothetical protein